MSNDFNVGGNGSYIGFEDLLAFYNRKRKECPKGVTLKLQSNKYLLLQFVHPDTGKRNPKPCNVSIDLVVSTGSIIFGFSVYAHEGVWFPAIAPQTPSTSGFHDNVPSRCD